ncbi:protein LONG AFTER FAR-RED 3 isoform X1 [Amaranthus tricolor]|uniref:protein LONG AFTER FAR-RED 3 isoform X1 n=1 Tax=Amaranthus tricolor TaxID=29722 RepID=UPI00258865B2|nr:protein LONG AFTER FAR-RED 3 isoform X1 [Amaranthus tricolor]
MMSKTLLLSSLLVFILSIFLLPFLRLSNTSMEADFADLLVTNAFIYTSDPSLPFADSMAVKNGRILRLGNYSSFKDLKGSKTKKLNLDGKIVVPGFIDSHLHLLYGGLQMMQVELHGVNTTEEFKMKIKQAVESKKEGVWILGGGWNNDLWGGEMPTSNWIDDISPQNPVWLSRMDGHMGLANSLALKLAGITRETKDPPGGVISRTSDGEPTGLLIDAARQLMLPSIPEPSIEERREALLRATNYALSKGVTTVVDMGRYVPGSSTELSWEDFTDVYKWADSSGNMLIRVCLFFPLVTWSRLADLVQKIGHMVSQRIYLGGVKAFFDGSLGSNSALFYEPYADDPENSGLQVAELDDLTNMTTLSDKSGLQVAIHCIGDKANGLVLDIYKLVASINGERDRRFRIEHAQHLASGATARFGKQGVVASVQPEHLLDDAISAARKLGKQRAESGSYLFRSLLESHSLLAFGSDWPVADIDPLNSIKAAVKRIPPAWETSWIPSQCITLNDALDAHTISAARACFLDKIIGSLSPGKLADFVILSTNSWEQFTAEAVASIEATYIDGIKAYSAKDAL